MVQHVIAMIKNNTCLRFEEMLVMNDGAFEFKSQRKKTIIFQLNYGIFRLDSFNSIWFVILKNEKVTAMQVQFSDYEVFMFSFLGVEFEYK